MLEDHVLPVHEQSQLNIILGKRLLFILINLFQKRIIFVLRLIQLEVQPTLMAAIGTNLCTTKNILIALL